MTRRRIEARSEMAKAAIPKFSPTIRIGNRNAGAMLQFHAGHKRIIVVNNETTTFLPYYFSFFENFVPVLHICSVRVVLGGLHVQPLSIIK